MKTSSVSRRRLMIGTGIAALSIAATATPALAVVPNETTTSDEIVDTEDEFPGVGTIITNVPGTFGIGICTGSLINPRTVLFAAHCVNDVPETAYDGEQLRAVVSFNVNALPGIQSWFANGQTNTALSAFNVNRIFYDSRSLEDAAGGGFLEADIALASLDTPAAGIPTWAMLFTTLPAPETIDPVRGTGYHVNIVGYGGTGTATGGVAGQIDFRRRAAENMLGGFNSLDDRNDFLFGPAPAFLPQNLYVVDFDSQNRSSPFDFNVHRDDALPNEGITAGGDSGGPLILDAANNALTDEDLVIGVLSGGSRFFGPQPFSTLGTTSFYQPLSLYWQYIVANNPYRYVGAVAGDGNWEDSSHWVTQLDPMYRVINSDGAVVNGLPTTPELGPDGTDGDFGQICFELPSFNECLDTATGELLDTTPEPAPADAVGNATGFVAAISDNRGVADFGAENTSMPGTFTLTADGAALTGGATGGTTSPAAAAIDAAEEDVLPAATLANGLPGATGFVPNNVDPIVSADPALNVDPRYYDVTLSQTGTTTLSSDVTIDRLTLRNTAGLTIAATGSLTSLIDVNQFGGNLNLNGALTSVGDYTLFAGMLGGTGTITAPFVTSIAGAISPGTMGTVGTLTIDGNLVLASGTSYLVDFNASGASDLLAVTGAADLGGRVMLGMGLLSQVNGQGRTYTILTAEDGITGTFDPVTISAILSQTFTYQEDAVLMQIEAASFNTVIDTNNSVQAAYARLFDQNRTNAALADLYGLDFATADTIRSTFTNLAPVNEQAVLSLSGQSINLLQNFNDARLREADKSRSGGKVAVSGRPLDLAHMSLAPAGQPLGGALMAMQDGSETTDMMETSLPENVGVFLSGGYVTGEFDSLPGFIQQTDVSGLFIAGGIEFYPGDNTMLGLSGYFNSLEADTPLGQRVDSETYAASLYMRHAFEGGAVADAQFSMGSIGFDTRRQVQFLGAAQSIESSSDDLLVSGALGLSYDLATSFGTISPGIEARYASVDLSTVRETGGTVALAVARENFTSTQARAGLDYEMQGTGVMINATAQMVFELEEGPQLLAANFVNGTGANANFVLDTADQTWAEIGISASVGNGPLQFSLGADTTIGRESANAQVIRGTATYRF
ncbi:autotransporter domain-containing protein [Erythrobacter sp. R86502]|uniref:autotransporter domain-containing protein n=1 Tax=Erythrobacter sp. R86502 TaxID=3093846 RepID=UPI0036D3C834